MKEEIAGRKPDYGFFSRLTYGVGEIFGGGCFVIINAFFIVFLTNALGMNPALAGTIPMIGKIWDAVTDPIMGNIVERTSSKYGPKRFYILVGSIASGIMFVLIWVDIHASSMIANYIYYMLMYCLFNTAFTVLSVPYNGLLPDMMDDYAMRAKFSNVRMIFSTLGAMICGLVPGMIINPTNDASLYIKCGILFGVIFFICSIIVFFGTWERQKEPVKMTLGESFTQAASVFRSRSFLIFLGLYLFGQGGMDFISGMAVYYVEHTLGAYNDSVNYYLPILAVMMVSQLIGMLIFGPVMRKTSKKKAIVIAAPVRLIGVLGLFAFSHHGAPLIPILLLAALIGLGNAGSLTGIFAIMADMTDVDELITSVRRPGIVPSMATFIRKIASGFSVAIIGFMLSAVNYSEELAKAGLDQTAATQHGIGICFILAPAILSALLLICALLFPVTDKEFNLVQKEVARRKGDEAGEATEEEKQILKKVTGFEYDDLWKKENAGLKNNKAI
ncbi:MAG: MFS transporter [Mogibacterium sp.]|nr:MFS transporter [Mogibacterium sp.]